MVNLAKEKTLVEKLYTSKSDYKKKLKAITKEISDLQEVMYAQNEYGMLIIFQALDAGGKDGTISKVFKGVNPLGVSFSSFKQPSSEELDHDFIWRCSKELPRRGTIKVFNRSYYEEVLVVKVHPSIVLENEKLPKELTKNLDTLWENRYSDINNFEKYLNNNGFKVIKFLLNISKEEQARRLLDRINQPEKNWKFHEGDIKERNFWNDYQSAFQDMLEKTSTDHSPWYVIPADDKKNMRIMVAQKIAENLKKLPLKFPEQDANRQEELKNFISIIKTQNNL